MCVGVCRTERRGEGVSTSKTIDTSRCIATVYPKEPWGSFQPRQCARARAIESEYCNQHNPIRLKAEEAKRDAAYKLKWKHIGEKDENALVGSWLRVNRQDEFKQILNAEKETH